ncbi:MAG: SpoIIE family protein phosphatase [Bacteroidia bacterium]|nr:SpoIIE family protein phosphatase [Bacteroidia bacterium]MDW8157568.1 SpoIIE family protein phosphatase [Bacteroidia bacterium]
MKKPVILCVDDEKIVLDGLWDQINSRLGTEFSCEIAESGEEGLCLIQDLRKEGYDIAVVISDHMMPSMRGDEFLIEVHKLLPQTLKILLTGQANFNSVLNCINQANLYRYVAKPWEENDLLLTVTEAARSYQQYLQLLEYNQLLRNLNKATQELSEEIQLPALRHKLMQTVLITTGAQKSYLVLDKKGELIVDTVAIAQPGGTPIITHQLIGAQTETIINLVKSIHQNYRAENEKIVYSPIQKNGKSIGYLLIENSEENSLLHKNYKEIIEMLASQAAISLENSQLYAQIQQRNQELQEEKRKVEEINQLLAQKSEELAQEKEKVIAINTILELRNKDITDSIHYAKRIQDSILQEPSALQLLFPDSFLFFLPKDIISGDFYWWVDLVDCYIVAIADCTGHGVPGAFMSLLGINLLNKIIREYGITEPSAILESLNIQLQHTLNNKSTFEESLDGMDIAVCRLEKQTNILHFAGAHRPLIFIRNPKIEVIEGAKRSIGEIQKDPVPFSTTTLALQPGDCCYLFSDGYVDQFGGTKIKKFSFRRLKELLLEISIYPMQEQKAILLQELENWKEEVEQTDDILMLGFKIQ